MEEKLSKEEYNSIPVVYCKNCLSLKILALDEETSYCDICGSTDVDYSKIEDWTMLYKNKYNKEFIKEK